MTNHEEPKYSSEYDKKQFIEICDRKTSLKKQKRWGFSTISPAPAEKGRGFFSQFRMPLVLFPHFMYNKWGIWKP